MSAPAGSAGATSSGGASHGAMAPSPK
jgi:hypothetical protein